MINKMLHKGSWLGDPNVTLISDDGHKLICHQSVLGIYDENLRSILSHHKMNEYVLIFEQTSHLDLDKYVNAMYSSFDRFAFPNEVGNSGQIELLACNMNDNAKVNKNLLNSSKIKTMITKGQTNTEGNENDQKLQNDTMVSDDDQFQNFSTVNADNVETKNIVNYDVKTLHPLKMVTDSQSIYDLAKQNVDSYFKSEAYNIPNQNKPNDVKEDREQQHIDRTGDGNQKIISNITYFPIKIKGRKKPRLCPACKICGYRSSYKEYVIDHLKVKHMNVNIQYNCTKCEYKTNHIGKLKNHNKTHEGRKYCNLCDFSATTSSTLNIHIKNVHEEKKNSCENCGKVFTMMYQLNNHKLKAHSDTPKSFFCKICDKSFHFRHDLNHHLKLSHNEKRFNCDHCKKNFATVTSLKNHTLTHNAPNIQCKDCDFKTHTKTKLNEHIERLHNEQTYFCDICDFKCKLRKQLKEHNTRKHDDTFQKFKCDYCTYTADRKDYLKTHIQSLHDKVRFQCDICDYQATRKQYLTSHQEKKHQN